MLGIFLIATGLVVCSIAQSLKNYRNLVKYGLFEWLLVVFGLALIVTAVGRWWINSGPMDPQQWLIDDHRQEFVAQMSERNPVTLEAVDPQCREGIEHNLKIIEAKDLLAQGRKDRVFDVGFAQLATEEKLVFVKPKFGRPYPEQIKEPVCMQDFENVLAGRGYIFLRQYGYQRYRFIREGQAPAFSGQQFEVKE